MVIRVTLTWSPTGWQGAEREYPVLMDRFRQTVTAWRGSPPPSRHPLELIHFPPSPKKFLHSYLGCLKSSWSRFKYFYFFRKKLRPLEGFDQMSTFWSMFWFKPFRNFLRKITIFRNFDQWSEILSMSDGRPLSQGVCPSLLRPRNPPPPAFGLIYEGAIVQPRKTTSFCDPKGGVFV